MTTLDIDHLVARYHDLDPNRFGGLDDAFHALADHVLEDELAGNDLGARALAGDIASSWAVCVDELIVEVELDPLSGRVAEQWAHAILDTVAVAIADPGAATDVVVYRREVDALIDLVVSVASGDLVRLWAWKQLGLVGWRVAGPMPSDVVDAVLARPSSIPTVVAVAAAECRAIFEVDEWVRCAHLVAHRVGSPVDVVVDVGDRQWLPPHRAHADVTTVPDTVWAAVTDERDRWALGVLCLAVTRPHLVRDRAAIAEVVDRTVADRHEPSEGGGRSTIRSHERADERAGARWPGAPEESTPGVPSGVPASSADDSRVISSWGGVWFLAHPLLSLAVADRVDRGSADVRGMLRAIVIAVTDAPADDPSVLGLVGLSVASGPVRSWEPSDDEQVEVERWATAITKWTAERAHGRLADRLAEAPTSAWSMWRRTVTIEASAGEIDITSKVIDVDIDIRMAGLDIDPGFVWWLGAVVRFRYV